MINTNIQYGDYAELIKNIPDKSIDLLLTDPPYEHIKGGCKDKEHWNKNGVYSGTSFMNTDLSNFGRKEVFDFLNAIDPKMKKMNAYIFCSRLQLAHYFAWISEHKYKYDLLFWNKATEGGYMVRSTKVFTNDIEYVVRLYEPYVGLNRIEKEDGSLDSKFYLKNQTVAKVKGDHETTKPLELLNKYIKLSSNEGDVVLDPFMGSGSTGVSCVLNGRNFIGFEKEKVYFDMAQRRITDSRLEIING